MGRIIALAVVLCIFSTSLTFACDLLDYKHEQVSERVHLFYGPESTTGIVIGNIVAVVGDDAILLVDGGQFHVGTLRALDQLKEISSRPVRYLVNTHWHGDHLLGNSAVTQRFPQVEILAHSHTIAE